MTNNLKKLRIWTQDENRMCLRPSNVLEDLKNKANQLTFSKYERECKAATK
jgi:hypothetical protein